MSDPLDTHFPELDGKAPDDRPLPWNDRTRVYRAIHTRSGRILQLGFIPNSGEWNRYLPLADLRLADARKDGTELVLEFSSITVIVTGRFLSRAADDIAIGRCAALEAFDEARRDPPAEPTNSYIESIRFFAAKPSEPGDRKPKAKAAAARQPATA